MKLHIRARHVELTPPLFDLVERRVRFALSRFGQVIRSVHCTLADVNGPKGGVDKVCRVRVQSRSGAAVIIEQADSELERAVDIAVDRAARGVARALDRSRLAHVR